MRTYAHQITCAADGCASKSLRSTSATGAANAAGKAGWMHVAGDMWLCPVHGTGKQQRKLLPLVTDESPRTDVITLTLPEPPSTNRYWRNFKGVMVVSAEAKQYKKDVAQLAIGITPMTGDVSLTIRWYRKIRKGDLGNREKILSDALQGIAFNDDGQISELHMYRLDTDPKNARVEIEVRELARPAAKRKGKKAA